MTPTTLQGHYLLPRDEARRIAVNIASSTSGCGEANLAFKPKAIAATLAA